MKRLEEVFLMFCVMFFIVTCCLGAVLFFHWYTTGVIMQVDLFRLICGNMIASAIGCAGYYTANGFKNEIH